MPNSGRSHPEVVRSLSSSMPVRASRPPRTCFHFRVECARVDLGPPPEWVMSSWGCHLTRAGRSGGLAVASADGICGWLTGGHPSVSDSGGYIRCGFRLMGVSRRSASAWSSMWQPCGRASLRVVGACRGPGSGELSGGNRDGPESAAGTPAVASRAGCVTHPFHDRPAPLPSGGGGRVLRGSREGRIWLILPVVICLSQRLSHACLSISTLLL